MARSHGTISCYKNGCRCNDCRQSGSDYDREYRRRTIYGLPTTDLVDAEPARAHARRLMQLGWRHADIARESGASHVVAVLYGKPSEGVEPLRRISSLYSRRILSLPLEMRSTRSKINPDGSRRRTQALCSIGHSVLWQAERMGLTTSLLSRVVNGSSGGILACHAVVIRDFYEQWWDRPAGRSRQSSLVRSTAVRKGYLPPLAWDDALIDLPEDELAAEVARQVSAWDDAECAAAYRAHIKEGDRSPLMVAGASEYRRRSRERAKIRAAAA